MGCRWCHTTPVVHIRGAMRCLCGRAECQELMPGGSAQDIACSALLLIAAAVPWPPLQLVIEAIAPGLKEPVHGKGPEAGFHHRQD